MGIIKPQIRLYMETNWNNMNNLVHKYKLIIHGNAASHAGDATEYYLFLFVN